MCVKEYGHWTMEKKKKRLHDSNEVECINVNIMHSCIKYSLTVKTTTIVAIATAAE